MDELTAGIVERVARNPNGTHLELGTMLDDGRRCLIIGNEVELSAFVTGYTVTAGDTVLVLRQNQRWHVIGALDAPHPPTGYVRSSAGGTVTLDTSVGSMTLPFIGATAPPVNARVAILWLGTSGVVVGQLSGQTDPGAVVTPPPKPPTPPPPRPPQTGTTTFPSRRQSTWRGGGWRTDTDDAIQGVAPGFPGVNNGAWFFGGAPFNALRGATCTGCWVFLRRATGAGVFAAQAVNVTRHGSANRPAGNVGYLAPANPIGMAVGQQGWFGLPVSWGQWLIANLNAGLGVQGSPYLRMSGPSFNGQCGAVRIAWRR